MTGMLTILRFFASLETHSWHVLSLHMSWDKD